MREALRALTQATEDEEAAQAERIAAVLPRHHESAVNLAHYLGVRGRDVRSLQLELAGVGLSSIGRSEGHVRDLLTRLAAWLDNQPATALAMPGQTALDAEGAEEKLHQNTQDLLGPKPAERHVYIMVTAPDAAEATASWADQLLRAGADVLRINSAHESPEEWSRIAATFKARAKELGREGRVFVDLPGPKLRADVRGSEPGVVRARRGKDRLGRTVEPARLDLVDEYHGGNGLPVPADWVSGLETGDVLKLTDASGRPRKLVVERSGDGKLSATCLRSLYVTPGLSLQWRRRDLPIARGVVGAIPDQPARPQLAIGDAFVLQRQDQPTSPGTPTLVVHESWLLERVKVGQRVVLDDGKLVASVEAVAEDGLHCRVERALRSPTRLQSGKGIAFPDSELSNGQFGPQDELALKFALEHADGVEVSFVNSGSDVARIRERIQQANRPGFGMTLKLETRAATHHLPEILFEALRYHPVGLMIARGDLAVELSFERLAEMQEELLWFGEACHLPVVWATQVLDSVAHTGLPTRAEVTDAAMSMRAECVMLNKGPYVESAVRMLDDIIRKMEAHQYKKRALYRKLRVASDDR